MLNRFAKDVGFLDDLLPFIFCEYFLVCCSNFLSHLSDEHLLHFQFLSFFGDALQSSLLPLGPIVG